MADRGDVERVRQRIDIHAVISRYLTLTQAGASYKGRCPFHKDDTPSFVVSPDKGLWHCFGCGEGGDVFNFLMKMERLSFPEALERLATEAGITLKRRSTSEQETQYEIMAAAAAHFAKMLRESGEAQRARETLAARGLEEETWPRFALGYASPAWDDLKKRLIGTYGEPALSALGLLSQSKGRTYDRFRDRIIFSILDLSGRVIAFGGRAFESSPKYLNSPNTPLFDKGRHLYGLPWARETLQRDRRAILVEGYTDVISLHLAGIESAVGSMGTALTKPQADLLGRFVDEVVIAYDRDAAGGAAALRGMTVLRESGLDVRVATLPEGADPDSLVRSAGEEGLRGVLEAAVPFHKHFAASLSDRFDLTALRGKEGALDETREFFRGLTNITLRNDLIQELHGLLGLTTDELLRGLTRGTTSAPGGGAAEEGGRVHSWDEETVLLAIALRGLVPWSTLRERIPRERFSPAHRAVLERLDAGNDSGTVDELPPDDAQAISALMLRELPFDESDRGLIDKAVRDALQRFVEIPAIESELRDLRSRIEQAETDDDRVGVDDLQRAYSELVAKRRSLGRSTSKGEEDAEAQHPS